MADGKITLELDGAQINVIRQALLSSQTTVESAAKFIIPVIQAIDSQVQASAGEDK